MSQNRSRRRIRSNDSGGNDSTTSGYVAAGALAAGIAAVAGGIYWYAKGKQSEKPQEQYDTATAQTQSRNNQSSRPVHSSVQEDRTDSVSGYLSNLVSRMSIPVVSDSGAGGSSGGNSSRTNYFQRNPPPANPCLSNLNALLSDIYVRYVQIQNDDFQLHYRVFDRIFQHLHQMMKEVDPYYRKYSSTVQFAGSHYDNLRIKKPDEFDMDIVISLPLSLEENPNNPVESDIIIEPKAAGYVQLRMGLQFQRLPMRDGTEWENNKAAYEWMDEANYLLRSKFLHWFKSVVDRALNRFEMRNLTPIYYVDGVQYVIRKSESGPAITLIIENTGRGFQLDVDLVPALKFPEKRWPISNTYRPIPRQCAKGEWMVVGKPIKNGIQHDQERSWRIALHNQERELMHNSGNLRQAVRLLKKLKDALGMKKIASYYVKTLFFWEIVERDDINFWQRNNPAFLFKLMVGRLHAALVNQKIPYFWNKNNNLIHGVDSRILFKYAAELVPLMQVLDNPKEYKQVARYLLTPEEFKEYNSKFLHI